MTRWTYVLALCGLLQASPVTAAEFEAGDPDDAAEEGPSDGKAPAKSAAPSGPVDVKAAKPIDVKAQKAKDDYEEYGPWKVKVPADYKGSTFKLRIGDEVIDLAADEITLKGSDFRERVDLIDDGGRIMSSKTVYVDPYVFDFVNTWQWRVGLYLGGASVAGSKFRQILQDDWLQESSLDFNWQPSALGLMVSLGYQNSTQNHDPGVTSIYEAGQSRLAATYEWVPMKRANSFFRRVHFLTYAGILSSSDSLEIGDDLVTLKSESKSTGGIVGNDLMFPLWRFWINVRVYASYHAIEFEEFDFEQKSVQHGTLIGGSYAF